MLHIIGRCHIFVIIPFIRKNSGTNILERFMRYLTLALLVAFLLSMFGGCISLKPKTYTYDEIQKEYANTICSLSPLEKEEADTGTCALTASISLTDAVKIALKNNPGLKMASARIRQANAGLVKAKSPFYPTIGFYTEYTNGDAPSAYLFKKIDQRELPAQTDFNDPGSIENFETGVMGMYTLYNGGRDTLNREMAKKAVNVSEFDYSSNENNLAATVIQLFYDSLAAGEFVKIADESATTVQEELRVRKVKYDAGGALKSDVLSLEVRLARAKEDVVTANNRYRMALTALADILGVSPDRSFRLKEGGIRLDAIPKTYFEGLEYAVDNRPELKKMKEQVVRSRMAIDASRSGYMPRVDINAKYYMDDSSLNYETSRDNWTVALMLNWNIFNGYATEADIKQATAMFEEMLAADRQAGLSVKLDVKNAYLKLNEADARLKVAETSVQMAEESLQLVKKQYEGGSVTITRYLEAELDRNRSRIRSTAAFYDREKALAEIARAIGYWTTANKQFTE